MGEIVNLRREKKRRARDAAAAVAAENRARHGRTAGEKAGAAMEAGQQERHLDGHRRDDAEPGPERG